MPGDVGGSPFRDGWEPDDDHDHGVPDDEFASVVFDEAFIRAATVHEPTAVERLVAAAEARGEAEGHRAHATGPHAEDGVEPGHLDGFDHDPSLFDPDDPAFLDGPYGSHGPAWYGHGRHVRWHRPVAWMLALLMGIGMVAFAFAAVYRGASADSGGGGQAPSPTSSGLERESETSPSTSVDHSAPAVPAVPRTP